MAIAKPIPTFARQQTKSLRKRFQHEYGCWKSMRNRCYNPRNVSFKYAGAKGVTVCDTWRYSFVAFLNDMGPAPTPQHTLDRFPDPNGNYQSGNVRWATPKQQSHNSKNPRWLTLHGRTLCLSDWEKETGLSAGTITHRLKKGWSVEQALTTPADSRFNRNCFLTFQGERRKLTEWVKLLGIPLTTIRWRLEHGYSVEEALSQRLYKRGRPPAASHN
jgi:hypothetical protein